MLERGDSSRKKDKFSGYEELGGTLVTPSVTTGACGVTSLKRSIFFDILYCESNLRLVEQFNPNQTQSLKVLGLLDYVV